MKEQLQVLMIVLVELKKKNGESKAKLVKISEGKFYLSYNTMVMKVTCT